MSLPVRATSRAMRQMREADAWWRENRKAARQTFGNELAGVLALVAESPAMGQPYLATPVERVRRVLLPTTRYHVYYQAEGDRITVLGVWHASRGGGPPLA